MTGEGFEYETLGKFYAKRCHIGGKWEALGRNRLTELGERMAEAKFKAPTDPLELKSARS